jgi:outer membrane lipoprotein-sorting protein
MAAILLTTLVVAGVGVTVVRADDDPALPAVTAQELLSSTIEAASRPVTISGHMTTTVDVGLPELPTSIATGAGLPGILTSLTGAQRWRVWHSPDGLRVAHLMLAREQDLVVNRDAAWWWDSADLRAIRLDLAAMRSPAGAPSPTPAGTAFDPAGLARTLIQGMAPCASVSVQGTTTVAGRDAYVLALTPLTEDSLVGSVRFAIDAATRLPLRAEVLPRAGGGPALAAGYTSVSFGPIDPAIFAFEPPSGATVRDAAGLAREAAAPDSGAPSVVDGRVFGECAGVIVAVELDGPLPVNAARLLPFAGPVGSALAVDRGGHTWVLAGLVDAGALEARAAELP